MSDHNDRMLPAARIVCTVHERLADRVIDCLCALGAHTVLSHPARCVRQHMVPRTWGWPGLKVQIDEAPMEVFYTTVPRDKAMGVAAELVAAVKLRTPGHGSLFVQEVQEISRFDPPDITVSAAPDAPLLGSLALITGILSLPGSGDELAKLALKMGVAVPVIHVGEGTGIRDRMGLLRITIPPEKEWVQLIVPAHDAADLMQLLIEEGQLDRPGGGFLYQTPIQVGLPDPMTRVGRQEHAATMEQLIAAMDELKQGTAWRKRFAGLRGELPHPSGQMGKTYSEIVFICTEGRADEFVHAAIRAGAGGVTIARVNGHRFSDVEGGIAARERGVICVPSHQAADIVDELVKTSTAESGTPCRIQQLAAPSVFSYYRSTSNRAHSSSKEGGAVPGLRHSGG